MATKMKKYNTGGSSIRPKTDKANRGLYKKGGSKLSKYQSRGEVTEDSEPTAPVRPSTPETPAKDYTNMSRDQFKAEKQGAKRAKKIENIQTGANKETLNKILTTVGNVASTAANVSDVVKNARNNSGGSSESSSIPFHKKGGITKRPATNKANRGLFKTGGMVNANTKITAIKRATGKVGGITKAISKVAVKSAKPKGKVGGTSTAPKKASPVKLAKAKMGGSKGKSC